MSVHAEVFVIGKRILYIPARLIRPGFCKFHLVDAALAALIHIFIFIYLSFTEVFEQENGLHAGEHSESASAEPA